MLRGGLREGRATYLIGRSGVGKTTVAVNMAVNAVKSGVHVAVASLEMTTDEVVVRGIAALRDMNPDDVETKVASDGFEALEWMKQQQEELNMLSVDDSTKPDWDELKAWVSSLGDVRGEPVRMLVLDHLKLMKRMGYPRGEGERVQQLAEDAKAFAKEADVALVVIHQVGRSMEGAENGEKNHGQVPLTMEDMFYGGEQDADVILALYRPELNPRLSELERQHEAGRTFLQVVKNRHGTTDLLGVPLMWSHPSMRIREVA